MPLFGTRVGLEDALERVRFVTAVSRSPITKGIRAVAVFAAMTWSGMLEMVGGVLPMALTTRVKLVLVLALPSLTVRVMVAMPL